MKLVLILILFTTAANAQENLMANKFNVLQLSSQDGKQFKKKL